MKWQSSDPNLGLCAPKAGALTTPTLAPGEPRGHRGCCPRVSGLGSQFSTKARPGLSSVAKEEEEEQVLPRVGRGERATEACF